MRYILHLRAVGRHKHCPVDGVVLYSPATESCRSLEHPGHVLTVSGLSMMLSLKNLSNESKNFARWGWVFISF